MADASFRRRATLFKSSQTDRYTFPRLVAGLNASSRFDHYREFKTALNAETYLHRLLKANMLQGLVRIGLGISDLKVHENRYVRSGVLLDNDCPLCPGMQDKELHLFFVCKKHEKIRPNMLKNIEPHHEHRQFVKLDRWHGFFSNASKLVVTNHLRRCTLCQRKYSLDKI